MNEVLQVVLKIALLIFMVGNMAGVGLELVLRDAGMAIRNVRFVLLTLAWSFVLCPALAFLLAKIIPLERPYTIGLLLLGMAPCAPFMPIMAKKARGSVSYIAIVMLLTAIGTVGFMPAAVPVMIKGMTVSAWRIAKPLLFFVLAPLVVGAAIREVNETLAWRIHPTIKKNTDVATIVMIAVMLIMYGKGFINSVGSFALATQVLFLGTAALGAYWLGFGLEREEKIVLSMSVCTRNIGAAVAPLLAMDVDPRATVMVVMAVPATVLLSLGLARWFSAHGTSVTAMGTSATQKSSVSPESQRSSLAAAVTGGKERKEDPALSNRFHRR